VCQYLRKSAVAAEWGWLSSEHQEGGWDCGKEDKGPLTSEALPLKTRGSSDDSCDLSCCVLVVFMGPTSCNLHAAQQFRLPVSLRSGYEGWHSGGKQTSWLRM
jgi:hypothetical protein